MFVLQDYLIALLISGTVTFMLANIFVSTEAANVEAAHYYNARQQLTAITTTLEHELLNMGAGGPSEAALVSYAWDTTGVTPSFIEFRTLDTPPSGTSAATTRQVRYEAVRSSSPECNAAGVNPCIELRRFVRQGGTLVRQGGIGPLLTDIVVTPSPWTGDVNAVRSVSIALEMLGPWGAGGVDRLTYTRQIRPRNLAFR